MLNSMREGTKAHIIKFVALGFVLLGVGGMVFMDVGGFFRNGVSDTTLARIGGTKINVQAFERTAQPAVRSQNMTMQEAYRFGLLRNLLQEMATREALRQEAAREGLMIGRDDIAARVNDMIKAQIQPGETPQKALERILQTQGMTQDDLVSSMRQSLTALLVQTPLKASVGYVPQVAAQALGALAAERRDIMFFTLTPENAGADIKPDEDAIKAYYDTIKDQYQIPEQRTFRALVLSADDAKTAAAVTDADVKAAFDQRRDQFAVGERRTIEQAVFQDEEKAKAAAESARKHKPLASLADAPNYRAPVETERDGLPAELAAPVFDAAKGTVLNPIKTPLGWFVVKVTGITPAHAKTFAEVQKDLRRELESDAAHSEMEARISKIDEALSRGDTLDEISKAESLPIVTTGAIDVKGTIAPDAQTSPLLTALSQNKDLLASLFELMEGETGDLAEVNDTTYAVFALDTVRPTRDRDLAEIHDEIQKKWLASQRDAAMKAMADKLVADLSKKNADFAAAAKEAGSVLKTARDVGRESKVAGLNDPVALTRLFDETDLDNVIKVPTGDGILLAKVLDARIPAAGQAKATPDTLKQWRTQMEQVVATLFISDVSRSGKVIINDKLLEKTYGKPDDAQP